MFRTRIISMLAAVCCLLSMAGFVMAQEVDCDATYCFSTQDFSSEKNLTGICITALPAPKTGTVKLGTRVLHPGDILTAKQLEQMTFSPLLTDADQDAIMTYLPIYADRVDPSATMTISVHGKQNQAPVAEDSAMETYKNIPNEALLKVKDPEGEALTFTVIRQPKRGEVLLKEDGSFIYTPKRNKVGVDSFTYTATDPQGNVSREATVTITIMKPENSAQYSDTSGKSCRFAAEWMKNTGLFVSERIGDNGCFRPEKEVSKGEFLTMLVNALEIPLEEDTAVIAQDAPDWLKPYLAAALRSGLTAGLPDAETFEADAPITGAEAAVMLQNALDLSCSSEVKTAEDIPTWAADAITILSENGISLDATTNLTRGQAAEVFYSASKLAPDAPGTAVFRIAQ